MVTCPVGLAVISTAMGVPLQVPMVGVTVYLTTAGELEVLVSAWAIVEPLLFEKPLAVPLVNAAVQEYVTVAPVMALDKPMPVVAPEQRVCWVGVAITVGVGFTVISTVMGVPLQVPIIGVTVYLTTAVELLVFVSAWAIVLPLPLEKPLAVPLVNDAAQEYVTVAPVMAVDKPIPVVEPEQRVCWVGVAITVGVGSTLIVKLCEVPGQPTDPLVNVGVTVMVAVIGEGPLLVAVKDGIPVEVPPLFAANPMPGVSLVQV